MIEKNSALPFWKDKRLTPEEQNKKLIEICRQVFNTPDGKIVLVMLLTDLFFFDSANNKKEQALNNYAKFLIRERLGINDTKSITDFIIGTSPNREGR
ncbi:MAG: hypothetical protein FWD78_02945 [Treponema sp.]|nr:hypothetical protein [Treponema sp.]